MRFGLLGTLLVTVDGRSLRIGSPKHRVLLAMLLVHRGRVVGVEELIDALWGYHPPGSPRRTIQTYVTRLRGELAAFEVGEPVIQTRGGGYTIDLPADRIDLARFEGWLDEARLAAERNDPDKESAALVEALDLWRGEPLADVPSESLHRDVVPVLEEQRLRAVERRIELDLLHGRHAGVEAELSTLVVRYPLREGLWDLWLWALHASGRRAEALAAYHSVRQRLADELGVEPGERLQRRHRELLIGTGAAPVPRQLPAAPAGFAGRTGEMATLDSILHRHRAAGTQGLAIIAGTAGVGKTALAANWARRVSERFPDGQLWINLRAHHAGHAVPPQYALTRFLNALGVSGSQSFDDQVNLYRSLMDGRRMLIVLDNAGTADQVRPLLPGAPGCFVLVTSRSHLPGLVAAQGAQPLALGLVAFDEAKQILVQRLGRQRIEEEPRAVEQIIERCARLPLALVVASARAANSPAPLRRLAASLADVRQNLGPLSTGDPDSDVRAVFSWSYRALSPAAARVFRLLSLPGGPDVGVHAAASLAGVDLPAVTGILTELCEAGLLTEQRPDRYAAHDLLRAYAFELTHDTDGEAERRAATERVLAHYLHTAATAAVVLQPHHYTIPLPEPLPGVTCPPLSDKPEAAQWYGEERVCLFAAITQAAESPGLVDYAWQLLWAVAAFMHRRSHWHELVAASRSALTAAEAGGHLHGQALAHTTLGTVEGSLGRLERAAEHCERALELYAALGNNSRQAGVHRALSVIAEERHRYRAGLDHALQALRLFEAEDNQYEIAVTLNNIGWFHSLLGEHRQTLTHCRRALEILRRSGDQHAEAYAWHSLGFAHHHLEAHDEAVACYRRSIELFQGAGNQREEARSWEHLGDTQDALGGNDRARESWRAALRLLNDLAPADTALLRSKIDRLQLKTA